ncbi:MAG TPA: Rieske 2Fe-2S domain-containing protein [Candidatus Acidoferrales bacterium]|nr:Rieske 2Fe-2S domain-containing protein [Candidatus Acidoferrales bacterium]
MTAISGDRVAVYRRTIAASPTRIWENVLDWEHLPYLHRTSFSSVDLISNSADGWRANVRLTRTENAATSLVDVQLHRDQMYYTTRTLEGAGSGVEILTKLMPRTDRSTEIEVEFFVPNVPKGIQPRVGEAYTRFYTQLWNEDEAMMVRRQAVLDANGSSDPNTAAVRLGRLDQLRTRLPFAVDFAGRRYRIVELDGALIAFATQCPHLGGPLDESAIEDGVVTCPWHGYRFNLRSRRSCDGRGLWMPSAPKVRIAESGEVELLTSDT